MSSSNPVKKVTDPLEQAAQSVASATVNSPTFRKDVGKVWTGFDPLTYGSHKGIIDRSRGDSGWSTFRGAMYDTKKQDVYDVTGSDTPEEKGRKQAEADIKAAQDAEARAANEGPKTVDELALERRKRAAVQSKSGRSGTDITGGTALGSVDVVRKMLLGM